MSLYAHQIGKHEQTEQPTLVGSDQEKQEFSHTAGRAKLYELALLRKAEGECPL